MKTICEKCEPNWENIETYTIAASMPCEICGETDKERHVFPDSNPETRRATMKRIGKIRVTREFFDKEETLKAFEWLGMAPIDARPSFMTGTNEIIGYSRHFDEALEGMVCPTYIILVNATENGDLEFSIEKVSEIESKDLVW